MINAQKHTFLCHFMRDGLPGASSLSIYITPLVVAANNRSVRLVTNFPYKIRPLVYIFREGFSFISIHLYKGETACPSVAGCTLSPASHLDKRAMQCWWTVFQGCFQAICLQLLDTMTMAICRRTKAIGLSQYAAPRHRRAQMHTVKEGFQYCLHHNCILSYVLFAQRFNAVV